MKKNNIITIALASIVFTAVGSMRMQAQETQNFGESEHDTQTNVICQINEVKAEYPGGLKAFMEDFKPKFKSPQGYTEKSARVIVSFLVKKDGSIVDTNIIRDPGFGIGEQVVEILPTMKKWKPAFKDGEHIDSQFTLPITIQIK